MYPLLSEKVLDALLVRGDLRHLSIPFPVSSIKKYLPNYNHIYMLIILSLSPMTTTPRIKLSISISKGCWICVIPFCIFLLLDISC